MKKTFSLVAVLIMTFFILPFNHTTMAEETNHNNIKNDEYDIIVKAMHADKNKTSGAARFINEDATLSVQDGAFKLTLTIPENKMAEITGLQMEGAEPTRDGEDWTYALDDLTSELKAKVQYEVPSMNIDHDVPLRFILEGLDDLPTSDQDAEHGADKPHDGVEDDVDNNTEDPKSEDKPEAGKAIINNADETREVEFITDSSSTKKQFNNPATLLMKDGKKYIEMTGTGGQFIKSLSVNGTEVHWVKRNDDGTFKIQFALPGDLSDEIDFGMTIAPPGMDDMNHIVPLSFKELKEDTPKDNPEKEDKPKEDPKKENDKKDHPKEEPVKDLAAPDKAYEVDYVINHEDGTKVSISNEFFKKPAHLLEKGDRIYIQMTIKNGDMIQELSNQYGDALVVKNNKNGTIVVQLRVDNDLADMMLNMHINVPDGAVSGFSGYNEEHKAILVFDKDSLKEVDANDFKLVAGSSDNTNGPIIEGSKPGKTIGGSGQDNGGNNDKNKGPDNDGNKGQNNGQNNDQTPDKPKFGDGDSNDSDGTPTKVNHTDNPKTGDTSQILLFSLLLISSFIPLAIKVGRKHLLNL